MAAANNNCNILQVATLAVVVILGLAILAAVVYQGRISAFHMFAAPATGSAGAVSLHTITVTASGSASAVPAQAQISIAANGTGATASSAVANLSATMSQVNGTILPYVNGNASRLSTTYFSVQKITCPTVYYPVPANYPTTPCNATGYVATEGVSALLPSYSNASSAASALANIPNVYIGSVYAQLSKSQVSALRQQAIAGAITNATSEAQAAAPAGTQLTTQNVTLGQYYSPSPYYSLAASNVASQPTLYSGLGSVTVSASVTFTYR